MSALSDIFHKIFPAGHPASAPAPPSAAPAAAPAGQQNVQAPVQPAQQPQVQQPQAPVQQVDVEEVLDNLQKQSGQQLNWRTSIVDLLKLLGLDSSLQSRKQLAAELHYTGDTNDSATMNVWLHKQVMNKVAENGGKVPADLKA